MDDETKALMLFTTISLIGLLIFWASLGKPKLNFKGFLLNLWEYGTSAPLQRFGFIILSLGFLSFFSWIFKREMNIDDIFNTYYFPDERDFIFFHLYLYFIPFGLLMTWGYKLLLYVKQWIFNGQKT